MKKIIAFIVTVTWSSDLSAQKSTFFTTTDYVRALKHATDVMVTDVTSPVAASRYYAYITLAANETAALFNQQQPHLAGVVKGLNKITVADTLLTNADAQFGIILALYKSAV